MNELMILLAGAGLLIMLDNKEQKQNAAASFTMQPAYDETMHDILTRWGFNG